MIIRSAPTTERRTTKMGFCAAMARLSAGIAPLVKNSGIYLKLKEAIITEILNL